MDEGLKKILLVTFSDNADHQDTLYGMYEQLIDIYNVYLLTINTPKVSVKNQIKHGLLIVLKDQELLKRHLI